MPAGRLQLSGLVGIVVGESHRLPARLSTPATIAVPPFQPSLDLYMIQRFQASSLKISQFRTFSLWQQSAVKISRARNYFPRHASFVAGSSLSAFFIFSAINTHEQLKQFQQSTFSSRGIRLLPSWEDLGHRWFLLRNGTRARAQEQYARCREWTAKYLSLAPPLLREYAELICTRWHALSTNERAVWTIIAINTLVFIGWRVSALQRVMNWAFVDRPFTKKSYTMLTACFSHQSPLHLAANMYALHSFAPPLMASIGMEQFIAVYLSSGMFSSLFSRYVRPMVSVPNQGSLGASGALFAVLAVFAALHPDDRLQLIFLPMVTFTAMQGLLGMMAFDAGCLLLGRTMFDHSAHLGGAFAGLVYARFMMSAKNNNSDHSDAEFPLWSACQRLTYQMWVNFYAKFDK
jgi:rhomboid-like protein